MTPRGENFTTPQKPAMFKLHARRGRSLTDSSLFKDEVALHSLDNNEELTDLKVPAYKRRLYELFTQIDKEVETLHNENIELRLRLNDLLSLYQPHPYFASIAGDLFAQASSTLATAQYGQPDNEIPPQPSFSSDPEYKTHLKKGPSRPPKWKAAFRGPSGKLAALRTGASAVGSALLDISKYRFVQDFRGHTDGVWHVCAAFSPDGVNLIGSASADQTAKIWLASDGTRYLANYTGHTGSVNSVSIRCYPSPVTTTPHQQQQGTTDGTGAEVTTSKSIIDEVGGGISVTRIVVLTTSGDRSAHIWAVNLDLLGHCHGDYSNSAPGPSQQQYSNRKQIGSTSSDSAAAAPDSSNARSRQIQQPKILPNHVSKPVVNVHQPILRLTGHSDVVSCGDWLFGGDQVITASWDRTANIYDIGDGLSAGGSSSSVGGGGGGSWKIVRSLSGHDHELTCCCAHPTQRLLATSSRDRTFRLWDFREPTQSVAVLQGHNDAVTSVAFSALHHIVSGCDDRTVKIWDLRNMRCPSSTIRFDSAVNRLAVCPIRNLLAVPLDSGNISIYDLDGVRLVRLSRIAGRYHRRMATCCAWLPGDNARQQHQQQQKHTAISNFALHPPLVNMVSAGFDKRVIGWHIGGGSPASVVTTAMSTATSPPPFQAPSLSFSISQMGVNALTGNNFAVSSPSLFTNRSLPPAPPATTTATSASITQLVKSSATPNLIAQKRAQPQQQQQQKAVGTIPLPAGSSTATAPVDFLPATTPATISNNPSALAVSPQHNPNTTSSIASAAAAAIPMTASVVMSPASLATGKPTIIPSKATTTTTTTGN